jgi:hypothetical protein
VVYKVLIITWAALGMAQNRVVKSENSDLVSR